MRRLALAAVLLAACGSSPVESGLVVGRDYHPSYVHHWTTPIYIPIAYTYSCGSSTNPSTCTGIRQQWVGNEDHSEVVPEWWTLHLRDCKANDAGEQKCREGDVTVSHDVYDRVNVGDDHWVKGQGLQ